MIISPPFLPDTRANESDETFVSRAMTPALTGKFPVSFEMQWHGGIHLQAPDSDSPVRAIADGSIVYLRQPTARPTNPTELGEHPLYDPNKGWTDNGCIVIKHQTEIGENITVTYYSIYMHLNRIEKNLNQGNNIYRKTKLGSAGQIYGQDNLIHFEIIAADDQIENIIGPITLNRNGANYYTNRQGHINHYIGQHGSTRSCFGNMYFYLPADTPTYNRVNNTHTATGNTLGKALYLEMKYHSGNCTFTAYDENGTQIGQPVITNDDSPKGSIHEYNLFDQSSKICSSMPTAGYELLRFGRILGTETAPVNTTHYRQIPTISGNTWVNLNTEVIKKYSDADFPFWKGWSVADDDTNNDSRCDSEIVRKILDNGTAGSFARLTDAQKQTRLAESIIQQKLQKIFYKFPTEWQNANFEDRFGWIKKSKNQGGKNQTNEQFAWFQNHVKALAFWEQANIGIDANHWHCPPIEFIKHFRKCGWLSDSELKQLVPSHAIRGNNWEKVPEFNKARNTLRLNINKMLRKYCINTPLRMACFFGNAIQESSWFGGLPERGGTSQWYSPWYGRGLLQLTPPYNYQYYWQFRGRTISRQFETLVARYREVEKMDVEVRKANRGRFQDSQFPTLNQYFAWREELINSANIDPTDSAGFYWAKNDMAKYADETHTLERKTINAIRNQETKVYYRSSAFWHATAKVNLPAKIKDLYDRKLNGWDQRCSVYGNCLAVLTEMKFPDATNNLTLEFPESYERREM
ncbi:M23 family metallopeptidase [Gilliamella apicola]|uniref:M23 family metallopeptidase n=1 Tax=Gilliamella apicola TaxID=1196095 RepID=UPI00080ED7A1|nr:M23 family metallopeptidase [Gilliamella apicola]OCG10918.1 hypothetical protein A9G14_08945 [Gilliamella apicola]